MGAQQSRRRAEQAPQQQYSNSGAPQQGPPPFAYPGSNPGPGSSAVRPQAQQPYHQYPSQPTFYPGWRPQQNYSPGQAPYPPPPQPHVGRTSARVAAQQAAQQAAAAAQSHPQELTQTATIRNSVNLKKQTLRLVPLQDDPQKLLVTFAFDASSPCAVSTFVGATEEPSNSCAIVNAAQPVAPSIQYGKELGLKFPLAGAPGAMQHVVDLGGGAAALMQAKDNTFPLIIRLETVTEKGAKEGHSLKELEPGGPQKPWLQSQTTFAALGKGEQGEYEVRVLKQKIWVESISYELQEIYGMDQAGNDAKRELTEAEAEDRLCVICLVNERDTTVLPCRHMCMCHECAQELRKQTQKCPICRNPVESLLHIKMQHKGQPGNQPGADGAKAAPAAGGAATTPSTGTAPAAAPVVAAH